jgi:hypothetical protein
MTWIIRTVVSLAVVVVVVVGGLWAVKLAGYGYLLSISHDAPEPIALPEGFPFAPEVDEELTDPDNPAKVFRVDFARVEHEFPLSREQLAALEPGHILSMNQEQIDQLYGRLTAGPIPDGAYLGDLVFPRREGMTPRLEEILGGIKGRIAAEKLERAEAVGRALWKGKMFYREDRLLRNFIEDFRPLRDLIDDPSALPTAQVPREGPLSYIIPNTDVWLLFPAKLHCGQSLLDGRRESIIIDYAYNDGLPGYQARPDDLVNRHGLQIRDEIRMVRPGFYLGRAYAKKIFLLNFVLYNEDVADAGLEAFEAGEPTAEECWVGEQVRHASMQ